ncbi:MAG: hypothetical protein N2Z21_01485, partial [Candidatus Sumerlaeaceae bacterium]|nr:hypothetical protein [Candidatus Sumerlaeaceae bacterium]
MPGGRPKAVPQQWDDWFQGSSRRGNGALSVLWFLIMLVSVGLMYYFYLKSERLERELWQLKKSHAERPASPTDLPAPEVVPEGAPPPQENLDTSTTTVTSDGGSPPSATPVPQAAAVPAIEVAHTPAPTPFRETAFTPTKVTESSAGKDKPKVSTKPGAGDERAEPRSA